MGNTVFLTTDISQNGILLNKGSVFLIRIRSSKTLISRKETVEWQNWPEQVQDFFGEHLQSEL